jgi:hypothetical protein
MAEAGVMEPLSATWAPVVYGRTAVTDTWWQAMPENADDSGWLVTIVGTVFAGGNQLDVRPRFVLAQNRVQRIVGVACRARLLNDQMCLDGQHRELSCFIGWMTSRSAAPGPGAVDGPVFAELQTSYAQWAKPVYDEVMGAVWELPYSPFRRPAVSHAAAAPWGETVRDDLTEHVPRPPSGLWPPSTWPNLWAAALVTPDPFTCVLGWQQAMPAAIEATVTYLGTADAPQRDAPLAPSLTVLRHQKEPTTEVRPGPVTEPRLITEPQLDAEPRLATEPELDAQQDRITALSWLTGRIRSVPRRWKLAGIIATAALVLIAVAVAVTRNSPGRSTTITITVTVSRSADDWFVYRHGVLAPGQRIRAMALWAQIIPASSASCMTRLSATSPDATVTPHRGQQFCVELAGSPLSYGIAHVTSVTAANVEVEISTWQ